MKGTFTTLNPEAKIFKELKSGRLDWWNLLCQDKELYIDIRKDNYINVYYYGGSVARIRFKKHGFVAETHQKYLGDDKPQGKTKEGKDKFVYDKIDLGNFKAEELRKIKNHIKSDYLTHKDNESPAEKWIQGKIICENPNYIDSELQFNKDMDIGKLRIDLVELSEGVLSFVELKVISDSRLRNDKIRNKNVPEIIEQIEKYRLFIKRYEDDIKRYYEKLIEIKRDLRIISSNKTNFIINPNPKLLIANTYQQMTVGRKERIQDIENLLKYYKIDYRIVEWK